VMMVMIVLRKWRHHAVDIAMNPPICVPPISQRAADLPAIVDSWARELAAELGVPALLPADRAWVLAHAASSLPEIEKGLRRILVIRGAPSLHAAAVRLGMAAISLRRWLERRASSPLAGNQEVQ
jgi:hypothetical protein